MKRLVVGATACLISFVAWPAQESQWETLSGSWRGNFTEGSGSASGGQQSTLLSREWFGTLEFTGVISVSEKSVAEILVRHAGETEGYAVVLDGARNIISLRESHLGNRSETVALTEGRLRGARAIRFHIEAKQNSLTAKLWPADGREVEGMKLGSDHIAVPEGRVGFAISGGSFEYSEVRLSGSTESSFETYAFRCNYQLAKKAAHEPIWQYLDAVGSSLLDRSNRKFKTVQEFEGYRGKAVIQLRRSLGLDPWPERTPLNARLTGTVDRNDVRIEKIIYESSPGFLVNALLYIPKKSKLPAPGILSPVGHYGDDSLFIWSEQARCLGLARKGYVVLTYDPIGQGERKWLGNGNHDTLRRKIILSGMEVSGLMMWDSIRGIDYLVSRPEVDPERIGVTGVSGGGFNTLYTTVLDERVKAAAPNGFATTFEALIKRTGAGCCAYLPNLAQYAEMQDVFSFIAPRKLLVLGGYMDVLSDRILPVFEAARDVYRLYGAEQHVRYYLDPDAGHTYSKPMRLEVYRAFNEWLRGVDDPVQAREPNDPENNLIPRDSGLLKIFGATDRSKDVIDLEREYLARNRQSHQLPSDTQSLRTWQEKLRQQLIELMGNMAEVKAPNVTSDDRETSPGSVRNVVLVPEHNLPVPLTIYHPSVTRPELPIIVYLALQEESPDSDLPAKTRAERLAQKGFVVAVPQMRGSGTTSTKDMNSVMLYAMALGKHLFSSRVWDAARAIDFLASDARYANSKFVVWGEGVREGPMALYLAAIDSRLAGAISSHGLVSYQDIVDQDSLPDFDYYVPGILRYADLPHLAASIAPRRVWISAPVDTNGRVVSMEGAKKAYNWTAETFQASGHPDAFSVVAQADLTDRLASELPR